MMMNANHKQQVNTNHWLNLNTSDGITYFMSFILSNLLGMVIGTHWLEQVCMETFNWYVNSLIRKKFNYTCS